MTGRRAALFPVLLALGPGASGLVEQGVPAPADLVLRGGKVITVDDLDRVTDALAVRGERIVAVGCGVRIQDEAQGLACRSARWSPRSSTPTTRGSADGGR